MLVRSELIRPLLTIKVGPGVTEGRTCQRSLPSAVKMAVQDHPKSRLSRLHDFLVLCCLDTLLWNIQSPVTLKLEILWVRCIQNFYGAIFFSTGIHLNLSMCYKFRFKIKEYTLVDSKVLKFINKTCKSLGVLFSHSFHIWFQKKKWRQRCQKQIKNSGSLIIGCK